MNTTTADSVVTTGRYGSAIIADATNKQLPTRIEVMRAGNWPEQNNKGRALSITTADLQEFVDNFKAGIGVPGGKDFGQIPIDFSHADHQEAAGWITDLSVEGNILFADVEWTDAGEAALKGGRFKCFSPSFWPACLGEYPDPENHTKTARNVLVGGGLTNIPFFKDLQAIMASNVGNNADSKNNKGDTTVPTFDEVRIKNVADLTADDKKVLTDNKDKLSADEQTKFAEVLPKVEADADEKKKAEEKLAADAKVTGLNEDDAKILASIKSGEVKMITATEYDTLTSTVNKLEADNKAHKEAEVKASVTEHVKRGAIKSDQIDEWTKRVVADATLMDVLKAIPSNKLLASEVGGNDENGDSTKAFDTKVKAAMDADNTLTYANAVLKVANEDSELANAHDQQTKQ